MPVIHEITDLTAPELDIYARLTQAQLRNRLEPEKGIFIAESPKVIARALDAGYQPLSLLMERKQITGQAQEILTRCGDVPVYTADRELLAQLTGFALTHGNIPAAQLVGKHIDIGGVFQHQVRRDPARRHIDDMELLVELAVDLPCVTFLHSHSHILPFSRAGRERN